MSRRQPMAPGRGWAYTGVMLGGLVSIAANITHTFLPPAGQADTWRPPLMAIVFSVCWPVFLFVAVEILARTEWPRRIFTWTLVRWVGLLPVAVVAASVSYRHLSGLLAHYGEEPFVALIGPLAVDGLMVMATGALIATGRHHRAHMTNQQAAPVPVAAPAPMARPATPTPAPTIPVPATAPPTPVEPAAPVIVPTPAQVAPRITQPPPTTPTVRATPVRSGTRTPTSRSSKPAADRSTLRPSTTDTPVTASDAAQPTLPVVPPALLAQARQEVDRYRTEHGTAPTAGQLAARMRVNSTDAAQALALMNLDREHTPTTPIRTVNGQPVKASR
jgi:hypothetical protein